MDRNALRAACLAYEARNGVDCFLDTVSDIVADVLARNGLPVEFDAVPDESKRPKEAAPCSNGVVHARA